MKIGVLGTGMVGNTIASKLSQLGHEVKMGSRTADNPKASAWAKASGLRLKIYSHSLVTVMSVIFLLSWLAQSIAGRVAFNAEAIRQKEPTLSWLQYIWSSDFWNRTFQNWQSEFLAVASMVAFAIYLRERGSPESKPVGTAHAATGAEG